jgi:hypothetical protein
MNIFIFFHGRITPSKLKLTAVWDTSLTVKVGTNFSDKRRPLGRYNSLAKKEPRSLLFFVFTVESQRNNILISKHLELKIFYCDKINITNSVELSTTREATSCAATR